jgi:hypothetical protein
MKDFFDEAESNRIRMMIFLIIRDFYMGFIRIETNRIESNEDFFEDGRIESNRIQTQANRIESESRFSYSFRSLLSNLLSSNISTSVNFSRTGMLRQRSSIITLERAK